MSEDRFFGRLPTSPNRCFYDFNMRYPYSRAQALAEGVLVDVSAPARQSGFVAPVALSGGLWADIQAIPENCPGESVQGRLQAVLVRAARALRQRPPVAALCFPIWLPVGSQTEYYLHLLCGPGDDGQPVVTLRSPRDP